jgi:hypothetical protein
LDVFSLQSKDLAWSQTAKHSKLPDEPLSQFEFGESLKHLQAGHSATRDSTSLPGGEKRPRGVAVDESVFDSQFENGPKVEAEMIDDARNELAGLPIEQLLESVSVEAFDRLVADLLDDVSFDAVFRRDSSREFPAPPLER